MTITTMNHPDKDNNGNDHHDRDNDGNDMFINIYVTIMIITIIMTIPMTVMMTMTIIVTTMTLAMTNVLVGDGHNKRAMRRTRIAQHLTNKNKEQTNKQHTIKNGIQTKDIDKKQQSTANSKQ